MALAPLPEGLDPHQTVNEASDHKKLPLGSSASVSAPQVSMKSVVFRAEMRSVAGPTRPPHSFLFYSGSSLRRG